MMLIAVTHAEYLGGFTLRLTFSDGYSGQIDLSSELWGPVFEPLKDPEVFRRFFVAGSTVCWPNGADFAPEFLRAEAKPVASAA
jgi:hypothetical protein